MNYDDFLNFVNSDKFKSTFETSVGELAKEAASPPSLTNPANQGWFGGFDEKVNKWLEPLLGNTLKESGLMGLFGGLGSLYGLYNQIDTRNKALENAKRAQRFQENIALDNRNIQAGMLNQQMKNRYATASAQNTPEQNKKIDYYQIGKFGKVA
jgi:hypothetical protein